MAGNFVADRMRLVANFEVNQLIDRCAAGCFEL
jgi:hypothetical protein